MANINTDLFRAIRKGCQQDVQRILDNGANVDVTTVHPCWNYSGYCKTNSEITTLQYAAKWGNEKIFRMIMERGANPLAKNSDGKTALHFAALGKNEEIVRLLLSVGADICAKDNSDVTTLHYAVFGGNEKIVKLMLDGGVSIDSESDNGQTPLHIACKHGSYHIMELILKYNPNLCVLYEDSSITNEYFPERTLTTAINLAIKSPNFEKCVNMLLNCGINVNEGIENERYETPVETAVNLLFFAYGDNYTKTEKTILEQLLVYGANINLTKIVFHERNRYACRESYQYCVELIVTYTELDCVIGVLRDLQNFISRINTRGDDHLEYTKIIVKHFVLIGANPTDFIIEMIDELNCFKVECEREIEKLKKTTFNNSTVSYFDFMVTKDHNRLASYLRNLTIYSDLTCSTFESTFPIYAWTLQSTFRKGKWRKLMLDRVKRFFHAVADSEGNERLPKLPFNCVSFILEQLSNKDLRMLIQVCDPVNGFNIDF